MRDSGPEAGVPVARLDGLGGPDDAEPPAPVARFDTALPPAAAQVPADLADPAAPAAGGEAGARVATLGAEGGGEHEAPVADTGTGAVIALFDRAGLGAGREDVRVARLGAAGRRGAGAPGRGDGDRSGESRRGARRRGAAGGRGARRERPGPDEQGPDEQGPDERGPEQHGPDQHEPDAPEERPGRRGGRGAGRPALDPDADPVAAAKEICLRLLTDRARTRQELAQALHRKGIPDEAAGEVLARFDEVGLIDDAAFAGQWVRSRHNQRGLARRAIAMELRRKGVSDEDAGEALAEVDTESEERRARELVDRKLRSLAVTTPDQRTSAARRLVGMLARKGYGAGVAYRVVREALAEHGADVEEELAGAEPADD